MKTTIERFDRKNHMHVYNSLSEFLPVALRGRFGTTYGNEGHRTPQDAANYVTRGAALDSPEVRAAVDLLNRVDATVHGRMMDTWEPDVSGAYPVVPEYLMGCPLNMRSRTPSEHSRAPVRIVVETAKSGGLSTHEQLQRGAAIAALAQRMSEERPVELHIIRLSDNAGSGRGRSDVYGYMLRLDTCPINMPQMAAIFTSESWTAMLGWNWANAVSQADASPIAGIINFAYGAPRDQGTMQAKEKIIRSLFDLNAQDIVFQGGFLKDRDLMARDPVQWVNKQLIHQRELEAE